MPCGSGLESFVTISQFKIKESFTPGNSLPFFFYTVRQFLLLRQFLDDKTQFDLLKV